MLQNGMDSPLILLAGLLIGLLLIVLPIMLAAKMLKARRYGFGWALLAFLLAGLISILAYLLLGLVAGIAGLPNFLVGLLSLLISLWAAAFAYAKMLRSSQLTGLGIYLISTVMQIILYIAILTALLFSSGMSMDQAKSQIQQMLDKEKITALHNLDQAGLAVCACGEDAQCAQDAMQNYSVMLAQVQTQEYYIEIQNTVHNYTGAAEQCERDASASKLTTDSEAGEQAVSGAAQAADEKVPAKQPKSISRLVYKEVSLQKLHDYENYPVRLTTRDGDVQEGRLEFGLGKDVVLDQAVKGGTFSPHLSLENIAKLEVQVREEVIIPE
ncbi:MAG: hypothetical protein KZQ58_08100 [gamma proteobacterium symbiont of Bathyaustriella thionipta]|nr:hypothetical protein [gamma proteobacterium symbiont of Bathyaustriella thionipta]